MEDRKFSPLLSSPVDSDVLISTVHNGTSIIVDTRTRENYDLTVVIPLYNVSQYVCETLNSVVSGAPDNLELVIVDDGSTDSSVGVVQAWVQQAGIDVIILTKSNAGLGAARNTGVSYARGYFIAFVDSDDWFDGAVYRRMIEVGKNYNADMVLCRSICFDTVTFALSDFPDSPVWERIMDGQLLVRTNVHREPRLMRLEPTACVRLFRHDFIRSIELNFPEGLLFEDLPVHVRAIGRAGTILLLVETGLYYRVGRPGQITTSCDNRRFEMLEIAGRAHQEAMEANLSVEAGAGLAGMVARMLYWCGTKLPVADRKTYFNNAIDAFSVYPASWWQYYHSQYGLDDRERLVIEGLMARDSAFLTMMSTGGRKLFCVLRLACNRQAVTMRRLLRERLKSHCRCVARHITLGIMR
jgi:glycosyltransferase involved in cell wall biosynthesis